MLDKAKFPASFAGDVSPEEAAFMADSQVPWGVDALGRHDQRSRHGRRNPAGTCLRPRTR